MENFLLWFFFAFQSNFFLPDEAERERAQVLHVMRSKVSAYAGQPVRFALDVFNMGNGWALLSGEILAEDEAQNIDWALTKNCDRQGDKQLWLIAKKEAKKWRVKEIDICAPRPPYEVWDKKIAFSRPCMLYKWLTTEGGQSLVEQCLAYQQQQRGEK